MTALCILCDEPFDDPSEVVAHINNGTEPVHQACLLRSIAGGINHQRGTCSCCGGDQPPDPPGLTRREAARVAFLYYQAKQR